MKYLYAFLFISMFCLSAKAQYQSGLLYQANGDVSLRTCMWWPCPPNSCPDLMYHYLIPNDDTIEVHTFFRSGICNGFASCFAIDTINLGIINRDSIKTVKMLIHGISKVNATDWDTTYNTFNSKYFQVWPLSINDNDFDKTFTLYPNPAQNTLSISNQLSKALAAQLSIMDITGRTVMEKSTILKTGNNSEDVTALPQGIYYLLLRDDERVIYQGRFVKE